MVAPGSEPKALGCIAIARDPEARPGAEVRNPDLPSTQGLQIELSKHTCTHKTKQKKNQNYENV